MPSLTWGGRKLQGVLRDLASLEEEGTVEGFFNNAENAGKLGDLVEDVRDAMMDYQVRVLSLWIFIGSNVCQTSLQQGIYDRQQGLYNGQQGLYDKQQDIYDKQQDIYKKQQDLDEKSRSIMVNIPPRLSSSWTHQRTGIGRPRPSQGLEPHRKCRIPLRE